MNIIETPHFRLDRIEKLQNLEDQERLEPESPRPPTASNIGSLLLVLDFHQSPSSHQNCINKLRRNHDVYTISLTSAHKGSLTHWAPTLSDIQQEFAILEKQFPNEPPTVCIGQGIGARLLNWLSFNRRIDVLCSPVFPDTEIATVNLIARLLLWKSNKHSPWFNRLIESSWLEALPQPTKGSAPWLSSSVEEQQRLQGRISNGTWKSIFNIIQHPVPFNAKETHILLGGQSPNQNLTTLYNTLEAEQYIYHRYYPERRQELLLAESVQRDILGFYLEAR